jgi:hypothetical protein
LARALTSLEEGEEADVGSSIRSGITSLNGRNKLIRLADKSSVGWAFVEEYLSSNIASDEEDKRKIERAEQAAIAKRKARQESSNRGRGQGRRGPQRGRGGHYVQYPYGQEGYQVASGNEHSDWAGYGQPYPGQNGQQRQYAPQQYVPSQYYYGQQYAAGAAPPPGNGYRRLPGHCYLCNGPHLMRDCPRNREQVHDVQEKIEAQYGHQ